MGNQHQRAFELRQRCFEHRLHLRAERTLEVREFHDLDGPGTLYRVETGYRDRLSRRLKVDDKRFRAFSRLGDQRRNIALPLLLFLPLL